MCTVQGIQKLMVAAFMGQDKLLSRWTFVKQSCRKIDCSTEKVVQFFVKSMHSYAGNAPFRCYKIVNIHETMEVCSATHTKQNIPSTYTNVRLILLHRQT